MRISQFDDDVRVLVRTAQDRARALGHPWIGCEHLLYAIAHSSTPVGEVARAHGVTPDGVAAQTERLLNGQRSGFEDSDAGALAAMGIDRPRTWRRRRVRLPGRLPVTGRARSCLEIAVKDAERGGTRVAEYHIGVAVVATDGGLVPPILAALGVSPPQLRTAILARVS